MKRLSEWLGLDKDVTLYELLVLLATGDMPEDVYVDTGDDSGRADCGNDRDNPGDPGDPDEDSEPSPPLTLACSEFWTRVACLVANLGCAWAVTSLLAWDGFFFQRLLFSLTFEDGRFLTIAQGVGYFVGGMVAVDYVYSPMYRSLPRVVLAAAAGFAVAVLVLAGYIAYGLAMTTNMAYPDAWEGFLWM